MILPKTYADIPWRESSMASSEAEALLASLPPKISNRLIKLYLDSDESTIKEVLDHFVENSVIFNYIHRAPGSALAFEYLYTRKIFTPIDQYFINCKAGFQIYKRLLALKENLPFWLDSLLVHKENILVDNIGSGTGRDMIDVLAKNTLLANKVKARHIDPDKEAITIGAQLAKENGVSHCFSFHPYKFSDVPPANADMALLIGILCSLPIRVCKLVLRNIVPYVRRGGIVIYSTALHKMLIEDPFTDFIMRFSGWHMAYKTEEESENLATSLGWRVIGKFFDEHRHYHCMVVAELP